MLLPRSKYSRTSSKRPPKMQKLSGRLREVLVFKNRTTVGSLPRRGLGTSILWKIMLLDAISSYAMCSSMLTKYHSAHSENRDRRMREVVPYKRLKTMENN